MLWRIATDNEEEQPRTSILALDALNKQDGVYQKEERGADEGVTINIQNFVMNSPGDTEKEVGNMTDLPEVIEGEFAHIKVEIPDQHA